MKYYLALVVCVLSFVSLPLHAQKTYLEYPEVQEWIDKLVREEHLDREKLETIFSSIHKNQKVIDLMDRAPERTVDWARYSRIFLNDKRIDMGQEFLVNHQKQLSQATQKYGIPENIITSILGVETYYGNQTGGHIVVESLATLAFDYPRRETFFRSELKYFLQLVDAQDLDALSLTGSYAGAMGYPQFMPSSYTSYAVDFDKDGDVDIWENESDPIGSIAYYLLRHGWTKGLPAAYRVYPKDVEAFTKLADNALKPSFSSKQVAATGIQTNLYPTANQTYSMLRLKGKNHDEYWLGTKNFYVISRYNPSYLYTMAIVRLAQLIAPQSDVVQ